MAFWLLKTEPSEWSWDDQVKARTSTWDGVTNAQALKNLREMSKGDRALLYHTADEKRAVGIVEVTRGAYADPDDASGKLVVVDVRCVESLPKPVSLATIKADRALAHLALVKQPRLSVVPIDDAAWKRLLTLAGVK